MKSVAGSFLIALLLVGAVYGQKNDKSKFSVIWGADANCDVQNSDEVKALRPQCRTARVEEMIFYIVEFEGISYAVTHRPVRDFLVASVQISNKTNSPIELSPKRSRLARYRTAEDYAANAQAELAGARSRDQLRKADYRENELIGEKEGGIRSGLQKRDKTEESIERGKIIRHPGPDEPAPPPTERPAASLITSSLLVPRAVFDNVLKSRTILVGEKAAGHLVFKDSDEVAGYRVFFLNAGQIEFVFPVIKK